MKANRFGQYMLAAVIVLLTLLPACGGDGGLHDGLGIGKETFWAFSYIDNTYYQTSATLVADGQHCHIYLEDGLPMPTRVTIDNLVTEFDTRIYPIDTAVFGSEPNPGADGDPKIFILLMDIRQTGTRTTGSVAGYFSPGNEYPRKGSMHVSTSNQKEMFYVDVVREAADDPFVLRTLAHEFQHMIHWEQKDHLRLNLGGSDDTWLNEGMSEAASILCYGTDAGRVYDYQAAGVTELSLTKWEKKNWMDYAKVAMWSQYMIDRFPDNVFRLALQSPFVGASSVGFALTGTGKTFTDVFNGWTYANLFAGISGLSGSPFVPFGHPEWTYNNISMGNLFWSDNTIMFPLPAFSSTYVAYVPLASGTSGTFQWNPVGTQTSATLVDWGGNIFYPDLVPGVVYPYSLNAFLVVRNSTGTDNNSTTGDNVVFQSMTGGTRAQARSLSIATSSIPTRKSLPAGSRGSCGTPDAIEHDRWIQEIGLPVGF